MRHAAIYTGNLAVQRVPAVQPNALGREPGHAPAHPRCSPSQPQDGGSQRGTGGLGAIFLRPVRLRKGMISATTSASGWSSGRVRRPPGRVSPGSTGWEWRSAYGDGTESVLTTRRTPRTSLATCSARTR